MSLIPPMPPVPPEWKDWAVHALWALVGWVTARLTPRRKK